MEANMEIRPAAVSNPACQQNATANRQASLCYTSVQKNTRVRPITHRPADNPRSATPPTQRS